MRFRRSTSPECSLSSADIIPFINIIFLLLIFLSIIFGLMISQQGLKINLPKLLTSEGLVNEQIELLVNSADDVFVNGKMKNDDELKYIFSQLSKRKPAILIKSDKKASLGKVAQICNLARSFGIAQIHLITSR